MLDYNKSLVTALQSVHSNVVLDLFRDSKTTLPCISYLERDNYAKADGDTVRHSYVSYTINVWTKTMSDLETYSQGVDNKMKELGFKRTYSTILFDGTVLHRVMYFTAPVIEITDSEEI